MKFFTYYNNKYIIMLLCDATTVDLTGSNWISAEPFANQRKK